MRVLPEGCEWVALPSTVVDAWASICYGKSTSKKGAVAAACVDAVAARGQTEQEEAAGSGDVGGELWVDAGGGDRVFWVSTGGDVQEAGDSDGPGDHGGHMDLPNTSEMIDVFVDDDKRKDHAE